MAIEVSIVGFDIAKNVFQVRGVDRGGETVLRKRLRRAQIAEFFRQLTPCLIGMEATRGAHCWSRVLRAFGHEVRLMAPPFVKPYLKSQKNDANDAEAICEVVSRPNMRFVPNKSIEQQDSQALHRIRSRMIGCRTQLGNQIRGLLAEYGIVLPLHLRQARKALPEIIEEDNALLSGFGRLPLHSSLVEVLCAWREAELPVGGWLFGNLDTGKPYHADTMRQRHLNKMAARIGLPKLGWHAFRHTYRARLAELGLPLEVQQKLMRHASIEMTTKYGRNSMLHVTRPANARVVEMVMEKAKKEQAVVNCSLIVPPSTPAISASC